jgi:uncharacterized protein YndB with AHSA1/START domain
MGTTADTAPDVAEREIVNTRLLDAPRDLVFTAWTDPDRLARWWGPLGFTNTFHEFDPRPGGVWRLVMHGPDGRDYQNTHIFVEIVPGERIILRHVTGPRFQLTATFAAETGKTRLTWHMLFDSAEDCAKAKTYAVQANEQNFDRLAAELTSMGSVARPFVISRSFGVPPELMWMAWTERDRLKEWFGPRGFSMPVATLDLRPGGTFHYCLRAPDGTEMWGKFLYREILAPEKIVLVNCFSDAAGGVTRHPFSPSWPLELLSTFTFAGGEGRTTVTVQWTPFNATDAERRTFAAGHDSMLQGWTGTFDRLASYLPGA